VAGLVVAIFRPLVQSVDNCRQPAEEVILVAGDPAELIHLRRHAATGVEHGSHLRVVREKEADLPSGRVVDKGGCLTKRVGLGDEPASRVEGAAGFVAEGVANDRLPTGVVVFKFGPSAEYIDLSGGLASGVVLRPRA